MTASHPSLPITTSVRGLRPKRPPSRHHSRAACGRLPRRHATPSRRGKNTSCIRRRGVLIFLSSWQPPHRTRSTPTPSASRYCGAFRARTASRGLVHDMFLCFFVRLLTLLASLCAHVPTDTLPNPQAGASPRATGAPDPSHAPPPDPRPHQSGQPEHRPPETASGGSTMYGPFAQPEMPPEIMQPIAEAPQIDRIVRPLLPAPPRRPTHVRTLKNSSGPTPTRPQHMDAACWPRWRGSGILCTRDAGILRLDSKEWVCTGGDYCVHFVTI
jgi:hypothetical protein